ncbi:MAG: PEGA domain-containing protein [Vicinamibacterales bacterium]
MTPARCSIAAAWLCGLLMAVPSAAIAQTDQLSNVKVLVDQARVSFDQLDYENTVKALDSAIGAIEARPTEEVRRLLPAAYEMRARSQFGLGKEAEARADFVSLLKADPGYTLTGQISPRILTLFDEVTKETVTELRLAIVPPDAEVLLDGARVPAAGTMKIAVGDHVLNVSRIGYKAATQPFSAAAETPLVIDQLALERVASVLRFVTAPAGVELLIDGISHGVTKPGPPPAEYAEQAARAGIPAAELSSVLIVTEIPIGTHRIEFRKDCFVRSERRQTVDQLNDYVIDPVKLEPAVATLAVTANQAGTVVLVDGQQRGVAPITISDVCEGEHLVELKSASGRYFRRVDARTGQKIPIEGTLRPAFAIVSSSGPAALNTDLRLTIEKQLQSSQSVTLFAPAIADASRALGAEKLPADWLAFDLNKRALGTAAEVAPAMRSELSQKLARTFDAQGIASVTVPSPSSRNRLVVTLLASGSGEPDVLDVNLDNTESVNLAVGRLDRALSFFRPSIGLSVVDVADIDGAVVVAVEPNGPASKSSIQAGDVVIKANGQDVKDAGALAVLLSGRKADEDLTLDLKDKAGAAKRADVKVFMTPRVIGLNDQSLMINRILVDLRARLQAPGEPIADSVMRLNLAVALARVGAWSEARLELQRVKLNDAPGVSNGTVLYLLGLAADRMGNLAEAEASWRAAAATTALLTEDGPPVKELAEARIQELQRRPRGLH